MKFTVQRPVTLDVKYVRMSVDVRYDDEDMPYDFPFRVNDTWDVTIDIDTGQILDWPAGVSHDVYMKVCDRGSYWLLAKDKTIIAKLEENYVPHGIIPGSYGDYIELDIAPTGKILNWDPKPDECDCFFEDEY